MRRRLIILSFLIFPALLTSGCLAPASSLHSSAIPAWYLTPRSNDELTLYGSGEGATVDEAKHAALKNIAESLSVEIGSSLRKDERVTTSGNDSFLSKTVRNRISAETKKIDFKNFEILRSEVVSARVFLLLTVDRQALIDDQKFELDRSMADFGEIFRLARPKTIFERWTDLKRVDAGREGVLARVGILASLDAGFDRAPYAEKLAFYRSELRRLRNQLTLYLRFDEESYFLKPVLASHLTDEGIKLAERRIDKDPNMATLAVASRVKRMKVYGSYIAKVQAEFKIYSARGDLVSGKTIEVKGSSMVDYDSAMESAGAQFDRKIEEAKITKILGIE